MNYGDASVGSIVPHNVRKNQESQHLTRDTKLQIAFSKIFFCNPRNKVIQGDKKEKPEPEENLKVVEYGNTLEDPKAREKTINNGGHERYPERDSDKGSSEELSEFHLRPTDRKNNNESA